MIFMQDGARVHTAESTLKKLKEWNIELLKWPPQSPDLKKSFIITAIYLTTGKN